MSATRLEQRFSAAAAGNGTALVTFLTAGDPDAETFQRLLDGLPAAGADVIEVGMPFSDPVADGPSIQAAAQRALNAGMTLAGVLQAVARFRVHDAATPVILMGYYNPVYRYGNQRFIADALAAGVDGLIIVDLPAEESAELGAPAAAAGLHWICLVTPTTGDKRLPKVLAGGSGFVYYVSLTGITGVGAATSQQVERALCNIRKHSRLPVAVGFGIRTPRQAAAIGDSADAVVVGSALVDTLAASLDDEQRGGPHTVTQVHAQVAALKAGLRQGA